MTDLKEAREMVVWLAQNLTGVSLVEWNEKSNQLISLIETVERQEKALKAYIEAETENDMWLVPLESPSMKVRGRDYTKDIERKRRLDRARQALQEGGEK